jgi:membrane protein CcdC involved in cytochrome C biogenesis
LPGWLHIPFASLLAPLFGAAAVFAWRIRETQRPVSRRSIVLPPLGMSTGLSMFLMPDFRVPWTWALGAFLVGALVLSVPLVRTSRLTRKGDAVVMQRSRAFILILLALVAVRILLRDYVGHLLPPRQTAAVFFLLAFGMIVRWRAWMLGEHARLVEAASPAADASPRDYVPVE